MILSIVLLSLDMMYPQMIFHCLDDDMMDYDGETMFRYTRCALGVVREIDDFLYYYLWI